MHSHSRDYKRVKGITVSGGYCNLGVVDIEGLEQLVEHLKERAVTVERVSQYVGEKEQNTVSELTRVRLRLTDLLAHG